MSGSDALQLDEMRLFCIWQLSAFAAIAQCTRTLNPDEKTLCREHAPVDWITKGLPSNCHFAPVAPPFYTKPDQQLTCQDCCAGI